MPAFWEHLVTQSLPIIINQLKKKFAQFTLSSFESFKLKPIQIWLPCMKMIWSDLTLCGAGCVLKKTWFKLRCGMVCLGWWGLWVDGCMVYYGLVWHGWVRGMVVRCMAWLSEAEHAMRVQLCQALLYLLHPACNGSTLYVPYKIFPAFAKEDWTQRSWYSTVPEGGRTRVKGQVAHT